MKKKKALVSIYFCILVLLMTVALLNINKENTSALSPLGVSADENFQMVSEEFGKDFERFIQDKVAVKTYEEEDGILIKFGEVNLKLKNSSKLIEAIGDRFNSIIETITG